MEKTRDDVLCGVSGVVLRSLKPVCRRQRPIFHVSSKALDLSWRIITGFEEDIRSLHCY